MYTRKLGLFYINFAAMEKTPAENPIEKLLSLKVLEQRIDCTKSCICVGVDSDGTPFTFFKGTPKELEALKDLVTHNKKPIRG